jgi:hypothetical protein
MFLHIMIGQNPKKSNAKETKLFKILDDVMFLYIFAKIIYLTSY